MNADQKKQIKAIFDGLEKLYDQTVDLSTELGDDENAEAQVTTDVETCADHIERAKDEIAGHVK
jgi:hypothetical protein